MLCNRETKGISKTDNGATKMTRYITFCGHLFEDHSYHVREITPKAKAFLLGKAYKLVAVFNPEQLTTWDEAKQIALHFKTPVNGKLIGGGLKNLTSKVETSGIYLPVWVGGPGGFPEPRIGKARAYLFRFKNGFEGANVGLVRELFKKYPLSPGYVMGQLGKEIGF